MAKVCQLCKSLVVHILRGYQYMISPLIGPRCRFIPSCSEYAIEAYNQHSLLRASWFTFLRLIRCHPLAKGGYDPVPMRKKLE